MLQNFLIEDITDQDESIFVTGNHHMMRYNKEKILPSPCIPTYVCISTLWKAEKSPLNELPENSPPRSDKSPPTEKCPPGKFPPMKIPPPP